MNQPNIQSIFKIILLSLQPLPSKSFDLNKQHIGRDPLIRENHVISFLPNSPTTSQSNQVNTLTNFFSKQISITKLHSMFICWIWNSARYTQPMHNFTPKRSSQFTIEKQVIGGLSDSTITYTQHKIQLIHSTAQQGILDGNLFFRNLHANNNTFKGAIILDNFLPG
jgi:hypothetical protein